MTLDELNDELTRLSDRSGAYLSEEALDDLTHVVAKAFGMV